MSGLSLNELCKKSHHDEQDKPVPENANNLVSISTMNNFSISFPSQEHIRKEI